MPDIGDIKLLFSKGRGIQSLGDCVLEILVQQRHIWMLTTLTKRQHDCLISKSITNRESGNTSTRDHVWASAATQAGVLRHNTPFESTICRTVLHTLKKKQSSEMSIVASSPSIFHEWCLIHLHCCQWWPNTHFCQMQTLSSHYCITKAAYV